MTAIFKTKFPAQSWRASAPDAKPVLPSVNAEVVPDWQSNQGRRGVTYAHPLRWLDVVFAIALGLVMCAVIASALGVLHQ